MGNGSNLLAPSKKTDLVIVCTRAIDEVTYVRHNTVKATCGTNINKLIMWCANSEISGLESLFGIPATVGGMVVMNAGAFGTSIFDRLKEITVFDDGKVETVKASEIETRHHWSQLLNSGKIVLDATFQLEVDSKENIFARIKEVTALRQHKQPKGHSAGSVFKNPTITAAGKLIEDAGLKGRKVGGAYVSKKHANFIISENATDKQVKKLIKIIQKKVLKKFGINLEREIEYIGEVDENYR